MSVRASQLVDVSDKWTALQFDNAVTLVGSVIEGAAQEMEKVGTEDKPEWRPKYTMKQLLDPDFRLPSSDKPEDDGFDDLLAGMHIHGLKFDEVG